MKHELRRSAAVPLFWADSYQETHISAAFAMFQVAH